MNINVCMYNIDGSSQIVQVTPTKTSEQICLELNNKFYKDRFSRVIVEVWKDEGIGNIV